MNAPVVDRIRKLIAHYDRGVITETELSSQIADCAIDPDFFHHLDVVPDIVVPQLYEFAKRAPAHPEDCLIVQSICAGRDFDYEAYDGAQRETAYWSARRLREHFYPNLPLPPFEPLKLAGMVDGAIEMDGSVVIFGDIHSYLIRKNPVHLIPPHRTRKITTSVSRMAFIKNDADLGSSNPITERFGRLGLFLDGNVKSTSDALPQTEVWVDRTAVADLPDPPRLNP